MKKEHIYVTILVLLLISLLISCSPEVHRVLNEEVSKTEITSKRWSPQRATEWMEGYGWLRGANFNPSTAINQLETWQAESFDPETIDKELGWAADIGFNCMRVYLHHAAWRIDPDGFKNRMNQYLDIAESHGISTIFVIFDDVWNPTFTTGKQPDPKQGVHNSGWVQDPGDLLYTSDDLAPVLGAYVKDILTTFKDDRRIVLWDLYNEPGNSGRKSSSLPLLKSVFTWAREVNPSQPLTAGVWNPLLKSLNKAQLAFSDVISYHNYRRPSHHENEIIRLKNHGRPLVCTEYMARTKNSTFQNIMPILKKNHVGAINWGLVDGKSNTKYEWDKVVEDGSDPEVWFHEVFRKDGTPYSQEEIDVIKSLTGME